MSSRSARSTAAAVHRFLACDGRLLSPRDSPSLPNPVNLRPHLQGTITRFLPSVPFWAPIPENRPKNVPHLACVAQDLQFLRATPTIRIRNRPAKQVGDQRWLNLHSLNRSSTRQSVLCAVSASPECLMNRGELHRLRTGSPAHCSRPSGSGSTFHRFHRCLVLLPPMTCQPAEARPFWLR